MKCSFIIIHQVYELWFKQLLHELQAVMTALDNDDLLRVAKYFRRIHTIQRLLEQQIDVLETMTPQEFNQFRDNLNPASGFQSIQFREIEFLCGVRRTETLQYIEMSDAQRGRLERRLGRAVALRQGQSAARAPRFQRRDERRSWSSRSAKSTPAKTNTTISICCSKISSSSTNDSCSGAGVTFAWSSA